MPRFTSQAALDRYNAALDEKVNEALHYLASCPGGITSVTTVVLTRLMLNTAGVMLAQGYSYDIIRKPLGGGVHQLTLRLRR